MAMPERLSAQAKVTATGVMFQVFDCGAGDGVAVIEGGVMSKFTFAQALAERAELSVAVGDISGRSNDQQRFQAP